MSSRTDLRSLRIFLRALWFNRVSIVTLAFAFLFFAFIPQVQDLFVEIPQQVLGPRYLLRYIPVGVLHADDPYRVFVRWHWQGLYVNTLLGWLLPILVSARILLHSNSQGLGVASRRDYNRIVVGVPRLLFLVGLSTVALGQAVAFSNLPIPAALASLSSADLFREFLDLGARTVITTDLTLLALYTLWFGVAMSLCLIAAFSLYFLLLSARRGDGERIYVNLAIGRKVDLWLEHLWRFPPLNFIHRTFFKTESKPAFLTEWEFRRAEVRPPLIFLILFAVYCMGWVQVFSLEVGRYLLISLIFGVAVMPLSLLAMLSHRLRWPFILTAFAAVLLLGFVGGDLHTVRSRSSSADEKQLQLRDAIALWKRENNCSSADCPRPIIVAASGGASRAAFFTGSIVGHLEDLSNRTANGLNGFHKQLFAISSVSGSSLAAVLFSSGLAVAREEGSTLSSSADGRRVVCNCAASLGPPR